MNNHVMIGRWFPPGTPVSSTRKLISSSFHRLDMTVAVAEALNPNKPTKSCNDVYVFSRQLSRHVHIWRVLHHRLGLVVETSGGNKVPERGDLYRQTR